MLRSTNGTPDKFATISRCCNDGEKKESGGVLMKGVCSGCRVTELPKVPGHATRVFSALFIQPPPLPGIRCIAHLIWERSHPRNQKLPRRAQLSATYHHHHHFLQSIMALAPQSGSTSTMSREGSRTVLVVQNAVEQRDASALPDLDGTPAGTLRLRGGPRGGPRVAWDEAVVDNEGLGRKKSKSTCK